MNKSYNKSIVNKWIETGLIGFDDDYNNRTQIALSLERTMNYLLNNDNINFFVEKTIFIIIKKILIKSIEKYEISDLHVKTLKLIDDYIDYIDGLEIKRFDEMNEVQTKLIIDNFINKY